MASGHSSPSLSHLPINRGKMGQSVNTLQLSWSKNHKTNFCLRREFEPQSLGLRFTPRKPKMMLKLIAKKIGWRTDQRRNKIQIRMKIMSTKWQWNDSKLTNNNNKNYNNGDNKDNTKMVAVEKMKMVAVDKTRWRKMVAVLLTVRDMSTPKYWTILSP